MERSEGCVWQSSDGKRASSRREVMSDTISMDLTPQEHALLVFTLGFATSAAMPDMVLVRNFIRLANTIGPDVIGDSNEDEAAVDGAGGE